MVHVQLRLAALGPLVAACVAAACTTTPSPAPSESTGSAQSALTGGIARRGIMPPPPSDRAARAAAVGLPGTTYAPTQGCASPLQYYGGPIIANPVVVQVSWNDPGTNGAVASSIESYLQAWWPAILSPQAGYLEWLTEYNTVGKNGQDGNPGSNQAFGGSGTYAGLYRITPSAANQGAKVADAAIGAELVAQIDAGHLPAPTYDASGNCNTIYMIDFPPKVTDIQLTFAGSIADSCKRFCGFHGGTSYKGKTIYYGVHPDTTVACTSCAPDGLQQDAGMIHSHELGEAMTDAEVFLEPLTSTSTDFVRPGGWDQIARGCSEIGDSCAWPSTVPTVAYNGQNYYVQGLYDNASGQCITQGPPPACASNAQCSGATPICDATSHTCRACTASDCTGATPVCETSGSKSGECMQCDATHHTACVAPTGVCDTATDTCVGCMSNTDCKSTTKPICDSSSHTCRACASNADCSTSSNHVCDTGTGACVACMVSSDCSSGVCDTANRTCVQCVDDSECNNPTPVCNTGGAGTANTCRGCQQDSECAGNSHGGACAPGGSCVTCTATDHSACTGGTPVCDTANNTCVQCVTTADCPSGQTCDPTTNTCVSSTPDGGSNSSSGGSSGSSGSSSGGSSGSSSGSSSGGSSGSGSGGGSGGSSGSGDDAGHAGGDDGGNGDQGGTGSTGGCAVAPRFGDVTGAADLGPLAGILVGVALLARRRRGTSSN